MPWTQCACDDAFPTATLAALRARLNRRLGFAAMPVALPGTDDLLNDFLAQAQELLYRRYDVFRGARWFTWSMPAGERFFDLPDNDEQTASPACTKTLDPRKVEWVGISQGDLNWRPLVNGINPVQYGTVGDAIPTHYEIRQCIEVWPAPSDATWKLRIKGDFGLLPFTSDAHTTTIDAEAVYLLALANAKAHYGQPDAGNYAGQLQTYIGDLVAGSHHTRRYIPGKVERLAAVPPKMA